MRHSDYPSEWLSTFDPKLTDVTLFESIHHLRQKPIGENCLAVGGRVYPVGLNEVGGHPGDSSNTTDHDNSDSSCLQTTAQAGNLGFEITALLPPLAGIRGAHLENNHSRSLRYRAVHAVLHVLQRVAIDTLIDNGDVDTLGAEQGFQAGRIGFLARDPFARRNARTKSHDLSTRSGSTSDHTSTCKEEYGDQTRKDMLINAKSSRQDQE